MTPDLHAAFYLGFSLDHDEAAAAQTFAARFGAPPEFVVEDRGVLYVGPVPEAQTVRKNAALDAAGGTE